MFDWLSNSLGRFYCQLGEVAGIGATAHLFRICGKTILADFGVAISRNGDFQIQGLPAGNFLIGIHIDLIIITHAHLDHFGAIARLIRHHRNAKVIVTVSALEAIAFMLSDSLKIMGDEEIRACNLGVKRGEPLFTETDLLNFLSNPNLIPIDLPRWLDIENVLGKSWSGWKFGFHGSGHDVGAMMSFIVDPSDWRYLITGDVCSHDQIFIKGEMLPDKEFCRDFFDKPEYLTLITEATHGATPMAETPDEVLFRFGMKLQEVENRGGQALIAAFSKNRCSKMAMACIELGYVPFIDGSGRNMMRIELGNDKVDLLLKSEKMIFADEDTKHPEWAREQRESLLNGDMGFHPYIAPSGTLEGGHSVSAAKAILPGRNNAVIFPGYLFPESTSKQIFEMSRGHTVILKVWNNARRRLVPTPANVVSEICHFNFTSHDFQGGLVNRVRLARPKRALIIHHCDNEAFETLSSITRLAMPNLPRIKRGGHLREIKL